MSLPTLEGTLSTLENYPRLSTFIDLVATKHFYVRKLQSQIGKPLIKRGSPTPPFTPLLAIEEYKTRRRRHQTLRITSHLHRYIEGRSLIVEYPSPHPQLWPVRVSSGSSSRSVTSEPAAVHPATTNTGFVFDTTTGGEENIVREGDAEGSAAFADHGPHPTGVAAGGGRRPGAVLVLTFAVVEMLLLLLLVTAASDVQEGGAENAEC